MDPVIVQPVAYAVDRRHSLEVLRDFLYDRTEKLQEEALWLRDSNVDCVLSDAVFLAWYASLCSQWRESDPITRFHWMYQRRRKPDRHSQVGRMHSTCVLLSHICCSALITNFT